jgi:paraquat-inducible protein B
MSEDAVPNGPPPRDPLPEPVVKQVKHARFSLVWLVPILAILGGAGLVLRTYLGRGPRIHITFDTAEGLEAGRSEVRYRNVVVGKVTRIDLSPDRLHIDVTAQLTAGAKGLAVDDTRFWVERPRIGIQGVSGISTLVTGAYVNVDIGTSRKSADKFVGLEKPPGVMSHDHGRTFKLTALDAGSLTVHSPVYYRKIEVGLVSDIQLSKDAREVEIQVFINSPYDQFVTDHTVFWNASGIDLSLNAQGLKLDTQSLATVVAGGIAFGVRTPAVSPDLIAKTDQLFPLYDDRVTAMRTPDGESFTAKMRFKSSVRDIAPGTTIDFEGIPIGAVSRVSLDFDPSMHKFYGDVTAEVFPDRLGEAYQSMLAADPAHAAHPGDVWQALVQRGLRAQVRTGNLLTGQIYIAWDLVAHPEPAVFVVEPNVVVVPTETGATDEIQNRVQDIVAKLDQIPFADIANDLRDVSHKAGTLLGTLDAKVAPQAAAVFAEAKQAMTALEDNIASPDSPMQQTARTTLEQIKRAAYSLRTLSDYLARHPESLIRGRDRGTEPSR